MRVAADDALDAIGRALRLWLLGQAIQMLLVGALSTLAVWLIGLPSPLALGVIAGVAEFVPYLGRSSHRYQPSWSPRPAASHRCCGPLLRSS
jgi:predicted PurR-regulated permease PerM